MPVLVVASLEPRSGRTTITAALGALLARSGRQVQIGRVRGDEGEDATAADDAQALAAVPDCSAAASAISEQEAMLQVQAAGDAIVLLEAPPGDPKALVEKLGAKAVLVSTDVSDLSVGNLASVGSSLGDACIGVVVLRQQQRTLGSTEATISKRGLTCLAVVLEDRLLAGPTLREMAATLHASFLAEGGNEEEAVESVMLGPVSADPGQPYFFQHRHKAVVNRFDKMDLHLAALATEPECLILTGGQQPSPYLIDRVGAADPPVTVLLAPDSTVRTVGVLDDLYEITRFRGQRKLDRAIELLQGRLDLANIPA